MYFHANMMRHMLDVSFRTQGARKDLPGFNSVVLIGCHTKKTCFSSVVVLVWYLRYRLQRPRVPVEHRVSLAHGE